VHFQVTNRDLFRAHYESCMLIGDARAAVFRSQISCYIVKESSKGGDFAYI